MAATSFDLLKKMNMREISPAVNMTVDEFLQSSPTQSKELAEKIRASKNSGNRPLPSTTLIDNSNLLSKAKRFMLLDKVAILVDENLFGRSEMCIQFSILLDKALRYFGLPSRAVAGVAIYFSSGGEIFRWPHTWVRIDNEVIDGNVDSLPENPVVPQTVRLSPYWGPLNAIPTDRRLREDRNKQLTTDSDVENIWWPDLKVYLDSEFDRENSPSLATEKEINP